MKQCIVNVAQRATAGRLYNMPKPTIAMLPGAAAGAGLSLASPAICALWQYGHHDHGICQGWFFW